MDIDAVFRSLVENGIDFFQQSAADLDTRPKYSVIHFAAGVEILLKARLLREHWSLVLQKPQEAKLKAFLSGDFVSVSLDEALKRIEDTLGEPLSQDELAAFRQVRNHRNRLVHFFHTEYTGAKGAAFREEIAYEQCKAWFYVERLVTDRWEAAFSAYAPAIAAVGELFAKNNQYLRGRFEGMQSDLKASRSTGVKHVQCKFCSFEAAEITPLDPPVMEADCLVCGVWYEYLESTCPKCRSALQLDDLLEGKCWKCGFAADVNFATSGAGPYGVTGELDEDLSVAYCMSCSNTVAQTVISLGGGYLCISCRSTFESIGNCDYCSESIAGADDEVGTYLHGCLLCEGKWGDVKDE